MFFRRLHPVPLIAGLVVALITVQLGNWQTRRAEEKRVIQEQIERLAAIEPVPFSAGDPDPPQWSRVRLVGEWMPQAVMYLDNRVHERRAGYHILMPLRLAGGEGQVLVNRGWADAGADRAILPDVHTPKGEVVITGRVITPEQDAFSLTDDPRDGLRWQYVDFEAYSRWSRMDVGNWVAQQLSPADDGLVREWSAPDAGIDTHRGYAFQWYSLAVLAIALTGYYVFRSFRANAA